MILEGEMKDQFVDVLELPDHTPSNDDDKNYEQTEWTGNNMHSNN